MDGFALQVPSDPMVNAAIDAAARIAAAVGSTVAARPPVDLLKLIPPFGDHTALQTAAFWLLAVLVPVFCISASVGVTAASGRRYAGLLLAFPNLSQTTHHRAWSASQIQATKTSFIPPLVFLFLLNIFMCVLLVAGSISDDGLVDYSRYMILCGPRCADLFFGMGLRPPPDTQGYWEFRQYQTLSLVAVSYAFLGWVCWALITVFDRATSLQILPGTFVKITIRLALAVLVAIVIRHVIAPPTNASWTVALAAFGTGMFPQRAVDYLQRQFNRLVEAQDHTRDPGLETIQGISAPVAFRLSELGIEDVADLAHANPFLLFQGTGYNMTEIVDWIGQAQLIVETSAADRETLSAAGVRTILDVRRVKDAGLEATFADGAKAILARPSFGSAMLGARAEFRRLAEVNAAIGGA